MDLDYNPNKLNTIATCGSDSAVRIWDLRKADKSLLTFEEDSSHSINKVKYNKFHDQLLITGCSSTFVSLYRASTVSSVPLNNVPLADLNSTSNTFIMTTMTMGDGAGFDTDRNRFGGLMDHHNLGGEDNQDKLV